MCLPSLRLRHRLQPKTLRLLLWARALFERAFAPVRQARQVGDPDFATPKHITAGEPGMGPKEVYITDI